MGGGGIRGEVCEFRKWCIWRDRRALEREEGGWVVIAFGTIIRAQIFVAFCTRVREVYSVMRDGVLDHVSIVLYHS